MIFSIQGTVSATESDPTSDIDITGIKSNLSLQMAPFNSEFFSI